MASSSSTDRAAVRQQLIDLLGGFLRTQAVATVARLGVADIAHGGAVPIYARR
jgi:hypothetical protein